MGNRTTLPLLLLAVLLAGGAFFWMSRGERGGSRGAPPAAPEAAQVATDDPAELQEPGLVVGEVPAAPVAARTEPLEAPQAASSSKAEARPGDGVQVSGALVDRFGTPIAGARVTLAIDSGLPIDMELEGSFEWMRRTTTETDAQGRFRIPGVKPGLYQVLARAHGFAPYLERAITVPREDTEIDPLRLSRGAILSGEVVDSAGRPVPGARILPQEVQSGGLIVGAAREPVAVCGADGRFRIDELACGPWRFRIASEDHPDRLVEGVSEEPGVEVGGLRWELAPGATISGTVTGIPAEEREHLEVRAVKAGSEGFLGLGAARVASVERNGSFVLRGLVPEQDYTLQARRARPQGELDFWERSRSNRVDAHAGDAGIVLSYQPEAALLFTVLDASTRAPIERFAVEAGIDWPVPVSDEDGNARTFFRGGEVRVGGLRPDSDQDRVRLNVNATGYQPYERSDLLVRAGQELDLGPILLDPVPVVRVRVLDRASGAPVVGARVRMQEEAPDQQTIRRKITLSPDSGEHSIEIGESRSATTDAEGWAELTSFEGKTVSLRATAEGHAPARITGLALPQADSVTQELRMGPGGDVLVRVVDSDGAPVAGARVQRKGENDQGGMMAFGASGPEEVTDSRGEVLFSSLEPGPQSFCLSEGDSNAGFFTGNDQVVIAGLGGGGDEEWSSVSVVEGQRVELVLQAPPRSGLSGKVREAGKVLAGATLRLEKEKAPGGGGRPHFAGFGPQGPETRSDGEGRYSFADVKAGRYTLTVEHPSRRMSQEFALELSEGDNRYEVDLSVSVIAGRVLDTEGKPLAGVEVWAERPSGPGGGPRMAFIMIGDDGDGGMVDSGQFGKRARTDADGRYELRGVSSDVDLVVKGSGDSVQPGQSQPLRVAPDEVRDGVDLRLEAAGSIRVEAKLADGSPARMRLVQATFAGESETPVEPKVGLIQSGSTELKGLRPGPWKVTLSDPSAGPLGASGDERQVEVKAQETASASFEVD